MHSGYVSNEMGSLGSDLGCCSYRNLFYQYCCQGLQYWNYCGHSSKEYDSNFLKSKFIDIDGGYVKTIEYNELVRVFAVFAFFTFQWWLNVILLFSDAIICYAVTIWFFEKRKETVVVIYFLADH